jgi:hypothetical protein
LFEVAAGRRDDADRPVPRTEVSAGRDEARGHQVALRYDVPNVTAEVWKCPPQRLHQRDDCRPLLGGDNIVYFGQIAAGQFFEVAVDQSFPRIARHAKKVDRATVSAQ